MEIEFGNKFTQKDIDFYIEKYFERSVNENVSVVFNLEQLEWVSSEEVTFLFAWLKRLKLLSRNVKVKLPNSYKSFVSDDDETVNRRKFLKYYLWEIWGLHKFTKENILFENYEDINNLYSRFEKYNLGRKVLPFQTINTKLDKQEKVDEKFYSSDLSFKVDKGIEQILNENDCYSPFENKIISEIITKELFMNSAEHAETDESYFTAAFKERWGSTNTAHFKDQFISEKDEDTLHFYKNKEIISRKIARDLEDPGKIDKKVKTERIIEEKGCFIASLQEHNESDDFKNQSYVEFTFIDFGKGIFSTLFDEYQRNKEKSGDDLSHKEKNEDSAILEYAFLLDSSKDPFDRRIDDDSVDNSSYINLIPRGLYFLIDMVRRYKGLLIARSGYGKVVYDFSNRIKIQKELSPIHERIYVAKDAVVSCKNKSAFIQGTMISIILPERKHVQKSDVTIDNFKLNKYIFNKDNPNYYPPEVFKPEKYEYLSLSFLYNVVDIEDISIYNSKTLRIKSIFKKINQKLIDLKGSNCVLFIDFEYLPTNENIFKILLYLSNSPLVNEFTKVIGLNLDDREFIQLKAFEEGIFYSKETSFLYKPIPCIKLNKLQMQEFSLKDIRWIGIAQEEDKEVLSRLFFGRLKDNNIDISKLFDKSISGNVLPKSDNRVYIFESFNDLIYKAKEAKLKEIKNWILQQKNKVMVDGEIITEKHPQKRLFLTSKGTYQKKYLSFYEKLSFKYTAQYFAQYLLDKYIDTLIDIYKKNHKSTFFDIKGKELSFYDLEKTQQDEIKELFKFDKILAVTVSSQLLAIEIRNLIRIDERYSFLKSGDEEPELIKLSSYFSFEDEKPLRSIESNQEILIVNDVISTGSLIKRQMRKIESIEGRTKGILSIVDVRLEKDSEFFGDDEQKIISIIASWKKEENNSDFIIERSLSKDEDGYEIKRINPILNSIVTLNSKHAEKNKILFENPKDLFSIKNTAFDEDIFQVGHFKQSLLSCSSFYINMKQVFSNDNGKNLLQNIRNQMGIKAGYHYKPTFIFYPISSAIEEVNEDTYHDIFGTNKANIIGLSRYETPYGWRFVFPPKRYNNKIYNEPILIIDSGTLSGQSLLQLIDAVSIYEVQRIDVLIIIGRLDDFQREFYSRIKEINVKLFDYAGGDRDRKTNKPINIYFGTNLHIPSYQAEDMCPFCKEIALLTRYKNEYSTNLSKEVRAYIDSRLEEIRLQNNHLRKTASYIPKEKKSGGIDYKQLFLTRDELGKINNYRFYEDYFSGKGSLDELSNRYPNEKWKDLFRPENELDLNKIELVLICLLHEPDLKGAIKDLLINLFDILVKITSSLISNVANLSKLNYNWNKYEVLRLYYIFCKREDFYHINNFELVFRFCEADDPEDRALNYFSFIIWEGFYNIKADIYAKEQITRILLEMNDKFDDKSVAYFDPNGKIKNIVKSVVQGFRITKIESVNDAFFNLRKFFALESSNESHSDLKRAINRLIGSVENEATDDNINNILDISSNIIKTLDKELRQNLEKMKECAVNGDKLKYNTLLFGGEDSIYQKLNKIIREHREIEILQKQIIENKDLKRLRSFAQEIDVFQIEYLLNNTDFAKYCKRFPTKLSDCINAAKKSYKNRFKQGQQESPGITIRKFPDDELYVNGHCELLQYAFEEIFYNATKCPENENATISFDTISKNQNIEFIIHQDRKFIKPKNDRMNGIPTIVEPIFKAFCGENGYVADYEKHNSYTIKIVFKKYELQNN